MLSHPVKIITNSAENTPTHHMCPITSFKLLSLYINWVLNSGPVPGIKDSWEEYLARNQESSPQKWYSGKRFIWKAFTPKGNGIWREKEMASALCTKASRLLKKKRWQLNVMYKYVEVGLLGAYAVELHASSSLECLISILNLHLGMCFLALKCGRVNKGQSFLLAKYVCEGDKI